MDFSVFSLSNSRAGKKAQKSMFQSQLDISLGRKLFLWYHLAAEVIKDPRYNGNFSQKFSG